MKKQISKYKPPKPTKEQAEEVMGLIEKVKKNKPTKIALPDQQDFINAFEFYKEVYGPLTPTMAEEARNWAVTSSDYLRIMDEYVQSLEVQFIHLFKRTSDFVRVMTILEEEHFIDPTTRKWIDNKKGYKELFISIVKSLDKKGYLTKVTNKNIQFVARNSFGLIIEIDSIKKTPAGKVSTPFLDKL